MYCTGATATIYTVRTHRARRGWVMSCMWTGRPHATRVDTPAHNATLEFTTSHHATGQQSQTDCFEVVAPGPGSGAGSVLRMAMCTAELCRTAPVMSSSISFGWSMRTSVDVVADTCRVPALSRTSVATKATAGASAAPSPCTCTSGHLFEASSLRKRERSAARELRRENKTC